MSIECNYIPHAAPQQLHISGYYGYYILNTVCLHSAAVNTLGPRQDGRHFADDIFKCIFLNENIWISTKISMKFVPQGPINNIPALVQIMAWHRPGDKSLSGPMMVRLPTHICVTRPQWVNQRHNDLQEVYYKSCKHYLFHWYTIHVYHISFYSLAFVASNIYSNAHETEYFCLENTLHI